jgi:hypothetical protein
MGSQAYPRPLREEAGPAGSALLAVLLSISPWPAQSGASVRYFDRASDKMIQTLQLALEPFHLRRNDLHIDADLQESIFGHPHLVRGLPD